MNDNYVLYDATAHIDEEILNQTINNNQKKINHPKLIKWVSVAACICLILGISLPIMNKQKEKPVSLGIYACAVTDNGLAQYILNKGEGVILKKIELRDDFNGFMFAVELQDKNKKSEVHYLTYKCFTEKPEEEIYALMNEKGLRYFYFVPDPEDDKDGFTESFTVYVTDENNGARDDYGLLLTRENGEYTVTLTSITSYPTESK